jgi:putative ABC transport system permease protein
MKNNNQAIVRKITGRALRSDKRRNFFIVAAIALTAFMIASVFSVGMSYYETIMITPFRSEGIFAHAFLGNLNPEQMKTLRSLDYVRRVNTVYRVGADYLFAENGGAIVAVNEESWRDSQTPAYSDIVGNMATAYNEIMLARTHLEKMGIDEPYIGMEVPMEYAIGEYNVIGGEPRERYSGTFILSAIYTEYVSLRPNAYTPVFVSEAFAEHHGRLNYENMDVRVIFTNQGRTVEYAKRLAQDLNFEYGKDVVVHPALARQADRGSSTMYVAIAIIVGFFMFVGFLLIYNVMYISVSKDVRFYGLLKTMGTTPRQLRRIVNGQVLLMYLIGLPIGLVMAVLTSFALVPAFISSSTGAVVSFSPFIYAGGAAFTLITAYLGASISAKKAAKVSPIEAIRYTGEQNITMKPRSGAGRNLRFLLAHATGVNGKPSRMAWRNMFRERKRAFIVLLSLFLGITVFTAAMAIVNSTDIAGNIDYWYDHDITIAATNTANSDIGLIGMDREFIEEIRNVPGVSEVREETFGIAMFDYLPEVVAAVESKAGVFSPFLEITGIDRAYMEELNEKLETPIDIEAFERGEIVLADDSDGMRRMGDIFFEHFPIGAELYFEIGQKAPIPVKTQIVGYHHNATMTGYGIGFTTGGLNLIMSNTYLDSVGAKAGTANLGVNIEQGMDESVNAAISAIVKERGMAMGSAYEAQREAEEARFTMLVLGSTLSGILALIGLFNFINLITVGLLTRKREFAALESAGMSKKQMRHMLRWEGAIYWIMTIAAQVTAGTGIAYGLFWLVHRQDPIMLPQFIYPALPVAAVFCIIVLICTITPEVCYRGIAKAMLVERLREAE